MDRAEKILFTDKNRENGLLYQREKDTGALFFCGKRLPVSAEYDIL